MASLSFIMDVTDDHTTTAGRRPLPSFNKRDRSPDDKPSTPSGVSVQVPAQGRSQSYEAGAPPPAVQPPPPPPPPPSTPPKPVEKGSRGSSSTTSPGPVQVEQDINPAAPAGQTIRHGASPKKPKPVSVVVVGPLETTPKQEGPSKPTPRPRAGEGASASTTTTSSPSSPSSAPNPVSVAAQGSAPAATATATATATAKAKAGTTTTSKRSRRPSNTANDPMDRSRYGSASSASTVSNAGLQRPVPPPHVSPTPYTPKYTPKTGRVSKAKKGLPVHVCDICRPIKTFTRAEHLRRHQLGHGAPQFQCTSCDRAFHRADLLMRHQQKHETDGDAASKTGSSHHSPQPSPSLSFQQVQQSPRTPRTPGSGLPASLTETELPSAPSSAAAVKQAGFASTGRLPHHEGGTPASSYRGASQPPPQGFHRASPFSPTVSIVNPTRPFHAGGYQHHHQQQAQQQHRNTHTPAPLYVVTESLQLPSLHATVADLPDLRDTSSPIPSSAATDSTYSAPLSDVSSRNPLTSMMTPRGGNRSPYLSSAGATTAASARNDAAPSLAHGPMFVNPYPGHQASEHAFGGAQGISSPVMGGYTTAGTNHHHHQQQHQQSGSLPSLRARTPPLDAFSHHSSETMIATSPRLPAHFDPLSGYDRRKDSMLELHHDLLVSQASLEGLGVLGSLAAGYGSAVSPGVEIASHHGGGNGGGNGGSIITDMADLAALGGSGSPALPGARCSTTTNLTTAGGVGMTIPLPGPIRAAIPRYLEVYWARVDPDLPIVHRTSFEAAPEDVLRCAMAAVATQGLDSAEDRAQGAVLHEFAWQEVKRIPQWSLQTMQAILLCEHFARFRGRKAVTRPSGPFESLYSRVSDALRSLSTPLPSSSAPASASASASAVDTAVATAAEGVGGLWLVDTTAWSPVSSSTASSSSSSPSSSPSVHGMATTPTTAAPVVSVSTTVSTTAASASATASSVSSSSSSHSSSNTATAMSPFALRHLSPLQGAPWGGFPSSQLRSSAAANAISSPSLAQTSSFPSPSDASLALGFSRAGGSNFNPNASSSSYSRSPSTTQQPSSSSSSWSSLFAPIHRSPPVPAATVLPSSHSLSDSFSSAVAPPTLLIPPPPPSGQACSQRGVNQQALYQNPALLDRSMLAAEQQHLSVHERWHNWIDTESRRRLLAACIFVDIHAAVYQQQGRVQDTDLSTQLIPLLGRATELWACGSAEEWVSILAADPGALQPEHFPPSLEHLTADGVAARSLPDRMIILSVLAQHLTPTSRGVSNQGGGFLSSSPRTTSLSPGSTPCPELDPHNYHHGPFHPPPPQHNARMISSSFSFDAEERIATLFPTCPIGQTYLALHHTPLRDLLAVSGDSWVFSQKGIPEASFLEHRKRLRAWVGAAMSGKSVIRATVHAARAILGFMGHLPSAQQQNSSYYGYEEQLPDYESLSLSFSSWNINISDYWAMYVCALICWAFAHSASPAHLNQTQNQPQSYIQGRAGGSRNTTNTASTTTGSSSSMTLTLPLSHSRPHPYSHSSSPSLSSSAIPSPQINSPTPTPTPTTTKQESTALTWLRNIASTNLDATVDLDLDLEEATGGSSTSAAGPRLEINAAAAIGVVALVRRRLEADCTGAGRDDGSSDNDAGNGNGNGSVGGGAGDRQRNWNAGLGSKCRSRLYVDAVGVLGKVEEGAGWRWF